MTNPNKDDLPNSKGNLTSQAEDEGIDFAELQAVLIDNKHLVAYITLFFLLLGLCKALFDTPIYKADVMLQVQEKPNPIVGLESASPFMEGGSPTLAEIEIAKSRRVLGETIRNLDLDVFAEPIYFPVIGKAIAKRFKKNKNAPLAEPKLGLSQYAWGGEEILIETLSVPDSWLDKSFVLQAGSPGHFSLLDDGLTILEGQIGKQASAQLEDGLGEIAINLSLLNARPGTQFTLKKKSMVNAINDLNAGFLAVEKVRNSGIISFSLESVSPITATRVLNELANIYVRQNVEQKSQEAENTLQFLDKQLPQIKAHLEKSTSALNDYKSKKGSIDINLEIQNLLSSVAQIKTNLTLMQEKKDELRASFTELHPTIQAINKQISELQAQLSETDLKIEALPETQQNIVKLSRDVEVYTVLYTTLLNNAQSIRVAKAGAVGNVRIIDEAVLFNEPIRPRKLLIMALFTILGLVSGVIWVITRKALHQGINDPEHIEKRLFKPVYATVPHSDAQAKFNGNQKKWGNKPDERNFVLALANKEDSAIESLRTLRTTLHFAFLEAQNNIIMLTGPSSEVGITFVSTNLAIVLADAGNKILLIDGDLRKGSIHKSLGVTRDNGLSDLISNSTSPDTAIRRIPAANIDFIPTGALPPNPSELLLHGRFAELLESLSKAYDHIIIDSPPVLTVSDAGIIGRTASVALMVVKAGHDSMHDLEKSAKRLAQPGVHLKGIVFNDLPQTSSRYGDGYVKYEYRYNYQRSRNE